MSTGLKNVVVDIVFSHSFSNEGAVERPPFFFFSKNWRETLLFELFPTGTTT